MAIIKKGVLRGQVGNVITREVGGLQIMQSKAGRKVKKNLKAKQASQEFGQLSRLGSAIRTYFTNRAFAGYDIAMSTRLIQQLQRTFYTDHRSDMGARSLLHADLQRLVGFQFNALSHLQDYMHFDPILQRQDLKILTVDIPAVDKSLEGWFKLLNDTHTIVLHFTLVGLDLTNNYRVFHKAEKIEFRRFRDNEAEEYPAQRISFNLQNTPPQTFLLLELSLLYLSSIAGHPSVQNNKDFNPSALIGAWLV